ncbi:MAG: glycosyltransferase [Casimicrobiaceae bacterium]
MTSTVIAAIPRFPGAYRHLADVPEVENIGGFRVFHPRYRNIPGVGMRLQPRTLAASLLAELARRNLDSHAFDVVDAHYCYPDGVAAASVADALGLPLVISARGSDINLIGGIEFAKRSMVAAARSSAALIAVSQALSDKMTALGMPSDRIHVLRNGVDLNLFSLFPRQEARAIVDIDRSGPLVIGVGNLVPEKGFDLLIRAVSQLPEANLLLVGDGPELRRLKALADTVAPGRVQFRSSMPQAELRMVYAAADVLGLPSLREGWPNVVLEAMACGTPVLASDVGGVPEMLTAGCPGIVASDRSVRTWSAGIASLIAAAFAPEVVRDHAAAFGWDEVITKQCALYEGIVRRAHARSPEHQDG